MERIPQVKQRRLAPLESSNSAQVVGNNNDWLIGQSVILVVNHTNCWVERAKRSIV